MKFYVFDKSVVGYKNIIKNKSSQDYLKVEKLQDGLICTIGDGHSSDFFTKSGKGAKFACEVTVDTFKKYINEDDNILIIDDFLANGEAALGAARLVEMAGAKVAGIGIVIEKSFQPGRDMLNEKGYDVYSLARVAKLGKDLIKFVEE